MSGKTKSLDALTGLRFFAAFAVFIHHISGKFGLTKLHWPLGAQAVSFFFVLSGFILTYVYYDRLKLSNVKKFYFTRWARIWPLHVVCMAAVILFVGWSNWTRNPDFYGQLTACLFLVQSWVPDTGWVFAINGVSWSISTEMFFYLMFPLFLLGGQKQFWIKYACLLALTATLIPALNAMAHSGAYPTWDFARMGHTNPLLRLPEFCTGMGLGYIYLNRSKLKKRWLGQSRWRDTSMEVLSLSLLYFYQAIYRSSSFRMQLHHADWSGPVLQAWFTFTSGCLFFAFVIYVFSRSTGWIAQLMQTRGLVFLGEVSFAFYMVHQIAIRFATRLSASYEGIAPWVVAACVGAISLGLSIILYKLVEMPAKSALLSVYDGKFRKGIRIPIQATWQFSKSALCIVVVTLLAVPTLALVNSKAPIVTAKNASVITQATAKSQRNIRFGESLVLLGYQIEPKPHGIQVNLAWKKNSKVERARFVHICDDKGKVVAYGNRESKLFQQAKIGETFVDSFILRDKAIGQGSSIGIGFHGKEQGMAVVNKGPRSLRNRRLDLVQPNQFARLTQIRKEKFGVRVTSENGNNTIR